MCRLVHIRHSRGYGIHSPFVYGLVREVMMRRKIEGADSELFEELRRAGVELRTAVRLQNYYTHYRCDSRTLNADVAPRQGELAIYTADQVDKAERAAIAAAGGEQITICVVCPNRCRAAIDIMIERHENMSVENREMAMFFYGSKRAKQHIII